MNLLLQASVPTLYRWGKRLARWFECYVLGDHPEGHAEQHYEFGQRYVTWHCDHCGFFEIIMDERHGVK